MSQASVTYLVHIVDFEFFKSSIMIKQINSTDDSVRELFYEVIRLSSAVTNDSEIDSVVNSFYDHHHLSDITRTKMDQILKSVGILKENRDGLEVYISKLMIDSSSIANNNSLRVINGARNLITYSLYREHLAKKVSQLSTSSCEQNLKREIILLDQDLITRQKAQNLLLENNSKRNKLDYLVTDNLVQ